MIGRRSVVGFDLGWGVGFATRTPWSREAGRTCGSLGRRTGVQRQVAAAKTQPGGAVESLFDFRPGAAQSGADISAPYSPPLAFPDPRVVGAHRSSHAYAEDLLQAMPTLQSPVRIAVPSRRYGKALIPEWPEGDL